MGTPTMTARGGAIESINPATEAVIATFEQFTPAQIEQALVEADTVPVPVTERRIGLDQRLLDLRGCGLLEGGDHCFDRRVDGLNP